MTGEHLGCRRTEVWDGNRCTLVEAYGVKARPVRQAGLGSPTVKGIATAAHILCRLSGEEDPDHSEEEVVPGDTSVGSAAVALAEFNRLRPRGRVSDHQTSKRESEPPPPSPRIWESGIGAIPEVLAEPAPCKTPVRSTRIRGVVTGQRVLAGSYDARGVLVWDGKSWCWACHRRLGNRNRAGSFGRRGL